MPQNRIEETQHYGPNEDYEPPNLLSIETQERIVSDEELRNEYITTRIQQLLDTPVMSVPQIQELSHLLAELAGYFPTPP